MWYLFIISVFLAAGGAVFLKKGSDKIKFKVLDIIKNWQLILGISLYALSMIFYLLILPNIKLSLLYPLSSLSYVVVAVFSNKFLGERISARHWLGISLIIIGCFILLK